MDPTSKSLYLKRRLQLLQAQVQPNAKMECNSNERDEATLVTHRPVMRNRKYLSLRVKLLKRQFGLPSDLMSLKSLSISSPNSRRVNNPDVNDNSKPSVSENFNVVSNSAVERSAYNGVDRVICAGQDPVTCVRFARNSSAFLVSASYCGDLCIHYLAQGSGDHVLKGHNGPVVDFDISQTDELIVSGALDGSLVLWHVQSGTLLRKLNGEPVAACRFMPGNNNLVVTLCRHSIYILNISTGKFTGATCSLIQGQTLSVEVNERGTLMWVGNDRGYIESFRLESNLNKIQKGCRVLASPSNRAVTSLSSHPAIRKLTTNPCLLATMGTEEIYLFAVIDSFGTISPLRSLSAGTPSVLRCSIFSRFAAFHQGTCVASGSQDGTLVFFDVERDTKPCINKLLGHSTCVISISYSNDERLLASADQSGQIIIWKKS